MQSTLLGGMSPEHFLAHYWHKRPLLIRQAIPGFVGIVDHQELLDLLSDPDVESRLIQQREQQWAVEHGPLAAKSLPPQNTPWTVLVQGLNLWLAEADALLHRFDFVPKARLDDLMVSYATDGGGIGAHVDSYDVFLLQGPGKRRWRISEQSTQEWVPDIPIKLLANFEPEQEWVLEPGDMLYLPPHVAHEGTAVGECFTYSIGFRAPSAQELGSEFLIWLQEHLQLTGRYADPQLQPPTHPGALDDAMVAQVSRMLERITWTPEDVREFLGSYLTEPKPQVFFVPPAEPLSLQQFSVQVRQHGFVLDPGTLMLFHGNRLYVNGSRQRIDSNEPDELIQLCDTRRIPPCRTLQPNTLAILHRLYLDGLGDVDTSL